MSGEKFPPEPVLVWRNIEILPVIHGVMENAAVVRRVIQSRVFKHVALELVPAIRATLLSAVGRLPAVSVIHYKRRNDDRYFLVESTSGLTEAVRSARERKLSIHLIDLDTEVSEEHRDILPDPYAITRTGWNAYCDAYFENAADGSPPSERERCMAHHLQRLDQEGEPILFVCGLYHAKRVYDLLETPQTRPLGRVHRSGVGLSHLDGDSAKEVTSEPAYLRYEFEEYRGLIGLDGDGLGDSKLGGGSVGEPSLNDHEEILFSTWGPDRWEALERLYLRAVKEYAEKDHRELPLTYIQTALKFCRNWVLLEGRLSPELYHIVIAARGVADDDFAYRVWDAATRSAAQEVDYDLPVMKLSLEDLGRSGRLMRFRRRIKQRRKMMQLLRQRPKEKFPGQWRGTWRPIGICSYPPEDLIIEGFGGYLKNRAERLFSEESVRVEPFEVSLADGIDVRETVRNWHEGRLYVKHRRPVRGNVGAVVVILDPDDKGPERFPWKLTWQGEHSQESDMAFYATSMGDQFVGPGISRSEYGGFLMSYPPGRMFQIWEDPYFDIAQTKPERLLLAALDYCMEEVIVYVSRYPPSRRYQRLAGRFKKKIFYLPLGQLSPATVKNIRFFHVLAGHDVRSYAEEFID